MKSPNCIYVGDKMSWQDLPVTVVAFRKLGSMQLPIVRHADGYEHPADWRLLERSTDVSLSPGVPEPRRLREQYEAASDAWLEAVAERDRYKDALERIATPSSRTDAAWNGAQMARIAREALGETTEAIIGQAAHAHHRKVGDGYSAREDYRP